MTNKTCLCGYFDDKTVNKIQRFAHLRGIAVIRAIQVLVTKGLFEDDVLEEKLIMDNCVVEELEELKSDISHIHTVSHCCSVKIEKLEEQLAYLESQVEKLC